MTSPRQIRSTIYGFLTSMVLCAHAFSADLILEDPFDSFDWNLRTPEGRGFWTSQDRGGLRVQAGYNFFVHWNNNDFNSIWRIFEASDFTDRGRQLFSNSNRFVPGVYTIRIKVGYPIFGSTEYFPIDDIGIFLMTGDAGEEEWDHRIPHTFANLVDTHIPEDRQWVTWEIVYNIDRRTTNNAGHSVVGQKFGFVVRARAGEYGSYAVDDLTIHFEPRR